MSQTMFLCDLVVIHPIRTGPHIPLYKPSAKSNMAAGGHLEIGFQAKYE